MKILIAYYSRSGYTEKMAREIEKELEIQGHLVDLEKVEPLKEHSFYMWWVIRTFIGSVKIKDLEIKSAAEYDLVLIGSPNWTRLALPMAGYLKKIKGLRHKNVALFSTTALWPNIEWYLFSSYLLDFTFEKRVEKAGGIAIGTFPASSLVKRLWIDSAYVRKNLRSFCYSLNFNPANYKRRTLNTVAKGTNRLLVILFTSITLLGLAAQIVLSIIRPGFLSWPQYFYFFSISLFTLYAIIITAQYERLIFLGKYFAGFSLVALWSSLAIFFPETLTPLLQYGYIIIVIFSGFFRESKGVIFTGLSAAGNCLALTFFLVPSYLEPSFIRLSAVLLVTAAVALIAETSKRKFVESVELEGELKSSNVQIKESDEAKSEFIAIASHNLRTPLTKLQAFFEKIENENCLSKEEENVYNQAKEGLIDLLVLSEGLLSVASLEEGKVKIQEECVDLNDVIFKVVEQVNFLAQEKNITIENHLAKKPVFVMGDKAKLKQSLFNILENGIKFNKEKGSLTLDLILDEERKEIVFSVRDSGEGIPAEKRKRIFSKFVRGKIYQYDNEGVGLGLYLTKLIVLAHHGRIWFHSKEGEGTTFYIALPLSEAAQSKHNLQPLEPANN